MSFNVLLVLAGWLVAMAIFFGFIVMLRYLHHRETMALISHGINPEPRRRRNRGMLRAGLIITMVGLALTIGLYPVGFFLPPIFTTPFHLGPWLLPGLIPLGVGTALIGSYYLEQNAPVSNDDQHENVIAMKDHQERKQKERY
ncbi:MAG: hypothetical protein H0V70_24860 [Ktedonobacteraceae bacterium]|nr:hypothetical protein [Ktedonobacteraceae bacterium]